MVTVTNRRILGWPLERILLLLLVAALGALLRLAMAISQGVNLDEGNYIADANNIVVGLVPFRDFVSREPLFVYSTAAYVKLFGPSLLSVRLQPITFGIVTTLLIAGLTSRISSQKTGILAAMIYSFSPFIISWGSILKLEQMGSMFGVAALLVVSKGLESRKATMFMSSGILLALGTLARRSELALAFGIVAFLALKTRSRSVDPRSVIYLILAYLVTFVLILAPFAIVTSFEWMWSILGISEAIQLHNQGFESKIRVAYSMIAMEGVLFASSVGLVLAALRRIRSLSGSSSIL